MDNKREVLETSELIRSMIIENLTNNRTFITKVETLLTLVEEDYEI